MSVSEADSSFDIGLVRYTVYRCLLTWWHWWRSAHHAMYCLVQSQCFYSSNWYAVKKNVYWTHLAQTSHDDRSAIRIWIPDPISTPRWKRRSSSVFIFNPESESQECLGFVPTPVLTSCHRLLDLTTHLWHFSSIRNRNRNSCYNNHFISYTVN